MATRTTLRTEVLARLGDSTNQVWTTNEIDGFVDYAIKGLYPVFYKHQVATITAGNGPTHPKPPGCYNVHRVGLQRAGTTRVRSIRGWSEGDGVVYIPKTGIAGQTLVIAWTSGFDPPGTANGTVDIPVQAEEVVVLRACVSALERLLSDRVKKERYMAVQVRQIGSEEDIFNLIDSFSASIRERTANQVPLPEKVT